MPLYFEDTGTLETKVVYSNDRLKRYSLIKTWDQEGTRAAALLYNPSEANTVMNDKTVNILVNVAYRHGHGSLEVVNLLPKINQDPTLLSIEDRKWDDENFEFVKLAFNNAERVILGWGTDGAKITVRGLYQLMVKNKKKLYCLGYTKKGVPAHPVLKSDKSILEPFTDWEVQNEN